MIKKSKKIMSSLLLALSLITILPTSNALAATIVENEHNRTLTIAENDKYKDFIENECAPTDNKYVYYNKKDGKYYGLVHTNEFGIRTKPKYSGVPTGHYAQEDGSLVKDTWLLQDNGYWYYFDSNYNEVYGYQIIDGNKYYFNKYGILLTGWERRSKDDDVTANWRDKHWYYYGEDGVMKEGWINSSGKWYYIYSDGLMAYDTTTPDGYHLDKNGLWTS